MDKKTKTFMQCQSSLANSKQTWRWPLVNPGLVGLLGCRLYSASLLTVSVLTDTSPKVRSPFQKRWESNFSDYNLINQSAAVPWLLVYPECVYLPLNARQIVQSFAGKANTYAIFHRCIPSSMSTVAPATYSLIMGISAVVLFCATNTVVNKEHF